jgi:hypothetical protein
MRLRYLPVIGILLSAGLTVTACSTATGSQHAAAATAASALPPASASPGQAGFTSALAAWKRAASSPAATMSTYLRQAADDLRRSGSSGNDTAISDLTYLAGLPATNATPAQLAKAQSDVRVLDSFFGTPGLLS